MQFVDSDDYLDPDFTERLVTAAEANNADLVIAPYWMVIPANSSKATQALENLQENLGIDTEKSLMISVNTASCPRASTTAIPLPCA